MLELKLVANAMAISLMSEMIRNEDKKKENETEEAVKNKTAEEIKQDCELNAAKRLLPKLKERYPRLPIRIIADSLYPSVSLIEKCEKLGYEYIFVLKDKKIPTIIKEFLTLVSQPNGDRQVIENAKEIVLTMWVNEIDYNGFKINVIRQIKKDKETGNYAIWM